MRTRRATRSITRRPTRGPTDGIDGSQGVEYVETFDKPDTNGLGPVLTWPSELEQGGKTWRTSDGRAKTTNSGGGYAYATEQTNSATHYARILVAAHANARNVGVLVGCDGASHNGYMAFVQVTDANDSRIRIVRNDNGSLSDIVAFFDIDTPPLPYYLTLQISGNTLSAYIDNLLVATDTDDGTVFDGTGVGVYSSHPSNEIESVTMASGLFKGVTHKLRVIAGQSLNLREGDTSALPASRNKTFADTQIWTGSAFETLVVGTNHHGTSIGASNSTFGLEVELAHEHEQHNRGETLHIVKLAQGSTDLENDWANGSTLRNSLYSQVSAAVAAIGLPVETVIHWNQGQTDAQDLTKANNYQSNLANFFDDLVTNLGAADKTIAALSSYSDYDYNSTIRSAQEAIATARPDSYLIDGERFDYDNDLIHHDNAGHLRYGSLCYHYDNQELATKFTDDELIDNSAGLNLLNHDFEINVDFLLTDGWHNYGRRGLVGKWDTNGNQREWIVRWDGDSNEMELLYSFNGVSANYATVTIGGGLAADTRMSLTIEKTGSDPIRFLIDDVELGTDTANGSAIFLGTAPVYLGAQTSEPKNLLVGRIYSASVTIDGTETILK